MRVLVTGAGGFVGKRLTHRLALNGHEVFALMRKAPQGADQQYFKVAGVNLVLQDLKTLAMHALPENVDALVTLAQSSRFREFPAQAQEVFAVNVTANLRLLQWAVEKGVKRVVHASSGGIYGGKRGGPFLETDLLAVDSPLGFYLGTKLCAEVVFQNYRHFFETAVILRPFFIYGPGQRADMFIARLVESVRAGRPISLQGSEGLRVNPIFVDDAVEAFEGALGLSGSHVINIAGPDVLTLRQVGDIIGDATGLAARYEIRPGDAVDYVGDTSTAAELLGASRTQFKAGIAMTVQSRNSP